MPPARPAAPACPADTAVPLSDALATALGALGCRFAFGVTGGAIGRFAAASWRAGLRLVHTRHEAGAAFMAAEASLADRRPALVFLTSGPGLSNALTGLVAGAWEGAHLVVVVGGTAADRRGRFAFQETTAAQLSVGPWLPPGLATGVHELGAEDGAAVIAAIADRCQQRGGSLSLVLLPTDVQQRPVSPPWAPTPTRAPAPAVSPAALDRCAALLAGRRVLCWVGHGARDAVAPVRALVDALGAAVICTPRGKGVVPETHPRHLGTTGLGGARGVREGVAAVAPEVGLVLGCRLGEFSSWWDPALVPPGGLVFVDAPTSAYPEAVALSLAAPVAAVAAGLAARLGPGATRPCAPAPALPPESRAATGPGMHPAAAMDIVQDAVVDATDAPVISEAGNAFAWATRCLRFSRPRYRVSPDFGAMGHAATGVVGMALARGGPAVALLGDGAMLMNNEVSTAVAHGAPAVWVVLNDAGYGMIRHGMQAIGEPPVEVAIPRVDFATLARAQGATGLRADGPAELAAALATALAAGGPVVIDVAVDPAIAPPFGARNLVIADQDDPPAPEWRG